jgi:hypothetical protein
VQSCFVLKFKTATILFCILGLAKAGTWHELPMKGSATDFDNISPEVKDLVRMSKKAHMVGRGNLMWMCWQPCGARKKPLRVNSISSGTMLLMVTPRGAGMLHQLFQGGPVLGTLKPGHIDVVLKSWLEKGDNAGIMGACYLTPPLGNYTTHQSGCDRSLSTGVGRLSCWSEPWVCRGTRVVQDPKKREKWFASWTKKGDPVWLVKASVDDKSLDWTSFWAGSSTNQPTLRTPEERRLIKKPAGGTRRKESSTGIEPTAIPASTRIVWPPPPWPPSAAAAGQPPRIYQHPWPDAQPLPDDPIDDDSVSEQQHAGKRTKRGSRFARQVLLYRSMRSWVHDRSKAD